MNIFEQAIDLHVRWKLRLTKDILDRVAIDISGVGNCHACELGAWIYGYGLKYNNLAAFEAMCAKHEHFHRAAAEVALYGNAGETSRATALLSPDGVFARISLELTALLRECSEELELSEAQPCPTVRVGDILEGKDDRRVCSTDARASIRDAVGKMVAGRIGSLVAYKDGKFIGLFTERGLVHHIAARGSISLDAPVEDALDHKLINVSRDSSLDDCMEIMSATHARYAVVLGRDAVEGVISIGDIVNELKTNRTYPYRLDRNPFVVATPGFGHGERARNGSVGHG